MADNIEQETQLIENILTDQEADRLLVQSLTPDNRNGCYRIILNGQYIVTNRGKTRWLSKVALSNSLTAHLKRAGWSVIWDLNQNRGYPHLNYNYVTRKVVLRKLKEAKDRMIASGVLRIVYVDQNGNIIEPPAS